MLQIDRVQQIEDVTVYGDDQSDHTFYLVPATPRFRVDHDGRLAFKFLKYRELRKDGNDLFGGICSFDTEFVVPEERLPNITGKLQEQVNAIYQPRGIEPPKVIVGAITYTSGTATLAIGEGSVLVQKVRGAGKPSLYGNNIATFFVELTKEGATVFEAALKGQGGFVGVIYDMKLFAKLPPITAHGWFHASQFYSFVQEINTEDRFWSEDSYEENIRELLIKNECMGTEFNFVGNPSLSSDDQRKVEEQIRMSVTKQVEDAVQRNLLKDIEKADPDTKALREGQDIEDVKRSVSKTQIANVDVSYRENQVIQWNLIPQGQLPNITTMKPPKGKDNYKWEDYAIDVDLDDEFFRTLEVTVRVNADFALLPIFNVEAKLTYAGDNNNTLVKEYAFSKPDDIEKFRAFVANDNRKYKYVYQVNYKGDNRVFTSGVIETDDTELTINVDDLGILMVDIAPGDINFTQVKQAQIVVRYEDQGVDPVERQFTMTQDKNTFSIREVIFKPRKKQITYSVKYFMADGREYEVKPKSQDGSQIYINDPFSAMKTVGLRAMGDLTNRVQAIMVDLVYRDATNKYSQTKSVALSKATPFFDWTFPVIDENSGEVRYSGTVTYTDGTSSDIPETVAPHSTINVGDIIKSKIEVLVSPDLLDFSLVKLVNVKLHYTDTQTGMDERQDFIFKKGEQAKTWTLPIKNEKNHKYTWSALFFMADGTKKNVDEHPDESETVILEVPA